FFCVGNVVLAGTPVDVGLDKVGNNINLSDTNPQEAAIRIINLALTFLGILAVGIILYGGFVWMKSNGSETEIDKAKKILKSGLIGLVIILSAWGIAYFVITRLIGTGGGNVNNPDNPGSTCIAGLPCFCGGQTVCNNGISSCANYDCSHATSTPVSCNGSLDLGVCQPNDNLCGSDDKICNANCLCEDKSQDGDSCGLKTDGSCDVNANNCSAGLTCNPNSCLCEGPMIISGISPVGGYCENDLNKVCDSSSDCPGSICNTTTPNGKEGNFLTIYGKNFNKASGNQQIFLENFENYTDQQTPNGGAFSDLKVGSSAKISIAKTPIKQSSSLRFEQSPGNVDGLNSKAEVVYSLSGEQKFTSGHLYGIQLSYQGVSANNLEIYFNDVKISVITPGQYTNQRSLFLPLSSLSASNSQKFKFVLVAGPTGNGTSLYLDDFSVVDVTNNQRVTIGGVVAKSAAEIYSQCVNAANNQLVVVIPTGVQNGEIIISRNGEQDSTNDNQGPKIPDFIKNTIARPGLCSLSPNAAQTNDQLSFFGNNLKNSSVFFGSYQENISGAKNLIDNNSGSSAVPSVYAGGNSLFVGNGKLKSNFLYFTKLNDLPPAPSITSISPDSGPTGQYVTIKGSNFGNLKGNGKVFFGGKEAVYQFPEECSYSLWSDQEILVKVPAGISPTTSAIQVITDSWTIDSSKNGLYFTFNSNQQLAPGVCRINPNRGPVNSKTTLFGENFGANGALANVYFNSVLATSTVSANNRVDKVEVTVPNGAVSGGVRLENSNLVNFQVGSCTKDADCFLGVCCSSTTTKAGQCAGSLVECLDDISGSVFEWAFSTSFGTTTFPNVNSSCLGISKEIGSCQTNETCPNVPGKCSSGSEIVPVDKGACCPDGYSASSGLCLKETGLPWSDEEQKDSFCKTLPEYEKRNRLVYSSNKTCAPGWLKIANDLCAKGNSVGELKEKNNCSLCAKGEEFINGKCAIRIQCKGNEVCNASGRCMVDEAPSCECCCQISNGNQDCCAPLTCGGTCGSGDANLGKCSGCYAAGTDTASRDAACNCSGHNGQFCAVSTSFPSGACV
ncbi:MAG: IPT/TIG domain-containing protein, partial [Patescibacteria group bacterium]|nr:IPT/TIG domain-containing protein [Patescibacteria group bacterium]